MNLLDAILFLSLMMILIELFRPAPLASRDVKVWSDDVERRILSNRSHDRR